VPAPPERMIGTSAIGEIDILQEASGGLYYALPSPGRVDSSGLAADATRRVRPVA
jgi:hypothetical protein